MELRRLGRSDLMVAPLVLGTNVFGWTADEKTSFAILDAFVDGGFNAVDTADVYSRCRRPGLGPRRPSSGTGSPRAAGAVTASCWPPRSVRKWARA